MASRPTARSSRAAIRQVRAPLENIWITDNILATAFERYFNVSRLSRRKSSSVPGPLENRRRLGKRRMTGLYSNEFQPTLPPWMLEFPVDLSQWTWSAPTTMEERTAREANPPAFARLWRLLAPAASTVETSQTQPIQAEEVTTADDRTPSLLDNVTEVLFESLCRRSLDEQHVRIMNNLQQDICLGLVSTAEVPDLLARYMHDLSLSIGRFLDGRPEGLLPRQRKTVGRAKLQFLTAIIQGLSTSRVQGLGQVDPGTCNALLTMLSEVPQTVEATLLFQVLMRSISGSHRNRVSQGIQAYLRKWLAAQANHRTSSLEILADSFGNGKPEAEEGAKLLDALGAMVTELCGGRDRQQALRIHNTWIGILARMPQVGDIFFGDALARYAALGGSWTPAWERRLCKLLVRHWRSQGLILPGATVPGHQSIGQLAYSLDSFKLRQSMLAVVMRMGARNVFFSSISAHCAAAKCISGRRLRWLAQASQDHRLALALRDLAVVYQHKMIDSTRRSFRMVLLPHVKAMIQDDRVEASLVWEVVNGLPENNEEMLRLKMETMKSMPTWFSLASHMGDRAMLRNISRCNAWLRSKGETPAPESVLAVARAGVRDLKRGGPGRSARHDWLVRLIKDCLGDDQAKKMATTLVGWQRQNRTPHGSSA